MVHGHRSGPEEVGVGDAAAGAVCQALPTTASPAARSPAAPASRLRTSTQGADLGLRCSFPAPALLLVRLPVVCMYDCPVPLLTAPNTPPVASIVIFWSLFAAKNSVALTRHA